MAVSTAKQPKTDADGKATRAPKAKGKQEKKGTDPHAFIKGFGEDYDKHLGRAVEAAEMTGTHAWRANYETQMHEHRICIDNQSKIIGEACEKMKATGTDPEIEKDIATALKTIKSSRERFANWRSTGVNNFKLCVTACADVRQKCVNTAKSHSREQPLIDKDLGKLVEEIVKSEWSIPRWDDSTGVVSIVEPKAG
ncbi:MAG: hypothetical protein COA96_16810 [SAR86 cluster bacterium]|uniref:Uncharacterized protein n=1 Tax=SAR86 cluster bacterium TaxID=2030880 RepID=A0A2A5AGR6_9GAMM|nr:MAG: hypothetical protein COA96_16810 [SAR86 cluster bacterium]